MPSASSSSARPAACSAGKLREGCAALLGQFSGAELANREQRVRFAQNAGLVPFHLEPGRISQHQIEAAALGKDIGKAQFPVHEAALRGDRLDRAHAREVLAQLADAQLAELVVQVGAASER